MPTSQNGWPVRVSAAQLANLDWITGRVVPGDVWAIFDHLCQRFDHEVQPITKEWSWGWAYRPIRGQSGGFSNHASGTAIDLNAPLHSLGKRGTFTAKQVRAIRRILADLDGVVRWGGDYANRPDEMHFEIDGNAKAVAKVARQIQEDDMAYTDKDRERDVAFIAQMKKRADRTLAFERTVAKALRADSKIDAKILDKLDALLAGD